MSNEKDPDEALNRVQEWFNGGSHLGYDPVKRVASSTLSPRKIFLRSEGELANVVSFMPGYPDGSIGWSKVVPYLPNANEMPKLFVEYLGMGDSDKPKDYVYNTSERADMVEAVWRKLGVTSTVLVGFDFSSLVILEILQRRLERVERGEPASGPEIRGVFILNGGLYTDGHSHPWYTTPILERLSDKAAEKVGESFKIFKMIMKMTLWSKDYHVTDGEVRALYDTMDRHNGLFYLAKAARFVDDHKAQGTRLDFGRLFALYHDQFPFVIGGSDADPFEHRRIRLTQERLKGATNLLVVTLPGGHLTTNEHPKELADLIIELYDRTL